MAAIISLIFGIIEFLVGFRFFLLLVGANPSTTFVTWIYNTSSPLVAPFEGILGHPVTVSPLGAIQSVFDPASLVAFVVYAAVGGILLAAFRR